MVLLQGNTGEIRFICALSLLELDICSLELLSATAHFCSGHLLIEETEPTNYPRIVSSLEAVNRKCIGRSRVLVLEWLTNSRVC